ncbi:carboxylesterase family protein [Paenibacillus tundrae]
MNQHNEKISEDSLYLNVWSGATSDQEKLPVLVYIHGGAFKNGSGSMDL